MNDPQATDGYVIHGLLSYEQAAKILGCHVRTVGNLVKRKELPAVRIGGTCVKIDPRDLQAYIDKAKGVTHETH